MPSFLSKIASALLAPIIIGATCVSCLLQAAPAVAASVPMDQMQEQDCANYQKPADAPASTVMSAATDPSGGTFVLQPQMSAHAEHDAGCAVTTDQALSQQNVRQAHADAPDIFVAQVRSFGLNGFIQKERFFPFHIDPQHDACLVGTVIKRE